MQNSALELEGTQGVKDTGQQPGVANMHAIGTCMACPCTVLQTHRIATAVVGAAQASTAETGASTQLHPAPVGATQRPSRSLPDTGSNTGQAGHSQTQGATQAKQVTPRHREQHRGQAGHSQTQGATQRPSRSLPDTGSAPVQHEDQQSIWQSTSRRRVAITRDKGSNGASRTLLSCMHAALCCDST
jgi:hypothetical protein